jgi:hypothetical protein
MGHFAPISPSSVEPALIGHMQWHWNGNGAEGADMAFLTTQPLWLGVLLVGAATLLAMGALFSFAGASAWTSSSSTTRSPGSCSRLSVCYMRCCWPSP